VAPRKIIQCQGALEQAAKAPFPDILMEIQGFIRKSLAKKNPR
jgi:hypothetical protein